MILNNDHEFYNNFYQGAVFVVKQAFPEDQFLELCSKIHQWWLTEEKASYSLDRNIPNYHDISDSDGKSHFVMRNYFYHFYQWNEAKFNLFSHFEKVIKLYEIMCDYPPGTLLNNTAEDKVAFRLQSHHYPSGGGFMQMHSECHDR